MLVEPQTQTGERDVESVLRLSEFGVAFAERIVLSAVTLVVPRRGVTVLMGPAGAGKSTLLRTIAGCNAANPAMRTWGEAWYAGRPLGEPHTPALVAQSARLLMASVFENLVHELPNRSQLTLTQQRELAHELLTAAGLAALRTRLDEAVIKLPLGVQRHIAAVRCATTEAPLLCVDEPTTGLTDAESESLLAYLRQESARRAVLVVLHNQEQARQLDGLTVLLAGGVVQEAAPAAEFFHAPRSRAAREYIRNGNCAVPAPDADPASLDQDAEVPRPLPEPARRVTRSASGPRGFLWLKAGRLAGTPRPGIVAELEHDLDALRRVGVTVLISLTRLPVDGAALARYGIRNVWSPIRDMAAPGVRQAIGLCREIEQSLARGEVIAVHCRAGLGRTGTLLAAYLIWEGKDALDALESARRINPQWVQSSEQVEFLEAFARVVTNHVPDRRAGAL
jgi:atypical dual specificity phosphatase